MKDRDPDPEPPAELRSGIDAVELYLRQGEPLLAYNAVQDGLRNWPENLRLRQLKGLAIARSGDVERANQLLSELVAAGACDPETLGMLARTHKDLALRTRHAARRDAHLASAFGIYHRAYEAARHSGAASDAWYTGINAATIAVLQDKLDVARRVASDVRDLCKRAMGASPAAADYWLEATVGEAALILGEEAESAIHYARAAQLAPGRYGNLASTRRQAELLAQRLPGRNAWISEVLRIPPVVMYTGHMIQAGSAARPRLSAALEAATAAAIRSKLASLHPVAAYGLAASGTDILFLEAMRDVRGEIHIVLPFPAEEYCRGASEFAQGGWRERLERLLAAADSVTITSDHRARGSTATFEYADLVLTGMARLRAQVLQSELCGFAIGGDGPPADGAGAASLLRLWRSQHVQVESIPVTGLSGTGSVAGDLPEACLPDGQPPGFSHAIRAMLFADVVGYSALSEDQTPHFINQFLGAVAGLNARSPQKPEHVETTGDGLYMVFGSVRDAGFYALELNRMVTGTDWAARGLPAGLNIRIALHCGPVYCGRNPVTGAALYTGPHTSRAARIEPVTPPGQVYASNAFAAVAAAGGTDGLSIQYVGRMPLAKGYGMLGLYHVRLVAEPDVEVAREPVSSA